MVARNDLARASQLDAEARMLAGGADSLDRGGAIVGVIVSQGPSQEGESGMEAMMRGQSVPVAGMPHPPQMLETIKELIRQRLAAIQAEMVGLGVTEPPPATEPQPAAARRR